MRTKQILSLALLVGGLATIAYLSGTSLSEGDMFLSTSDRYDREYNKFTLNFKRGIQTKEEFKHRKSVFKKNLMFIEDFNAREAEKEGYWLGVNQFADTT